MRFVHGNVLLAAAALLLAAGCWSAASLPHSLRHLFVTPRYDASSSLLLAGLACALFGLAWRVLARDSRAGRPGTRAKRRAWQHLRPCRPRFTTRLP